MAGKRGGKIKRGADKHYPLMSIKEIDIFCKHEIEENCEQDCHLYLWVTNNYLRDGLNLIEKWGFHYKTLITWMKDRFGLGQYYRGITEHCIFAIRGNLPYKSINGKRAQGKTGFIAKRMEHSHKPDEMQHMIEIVSYPPYLELFARRNKEGWSCKGNQLELEKQGGLNSYCKL